MPRGSEALKLFEEGKVLGSDMGGGVKLRFNHVTHKMECLHEGQLPISPDCENQWVTVSIDLASLFKYEWSVVEGVE